MPLTRLRTIILPAFAVTALAVTLVGCGAGTGSTDSAGSDCAQPGASSDKIEVSGDADATPTVDFPAPLTTTETERTVITEGEGDGVEDGGIATVSITAYNGSTGDEVQALTAEDLAFTTGQTAPFLDDVVLCSTAGSRIAAVIPPIEGIDQTGQDVGLGVNDSVVVVIDVTDVAEPVEVLPRADGEDQPLPDGFPDITVELDDDGVPTVTLPDIAPPTDFQVAVLKKGDGPVVEENANVTTNYQGIIWSSKTVFNDSWASGAPVPFNVSQVVPGFSEMLIGQTVGSQVIAVLPPASGYGDSPPDGSGIAAGDTLVFIVDILATQ